MISPQTASLESAYNLSMDPNQAYPVVPSVKVKVSQPPIIVVKSKKLMTHHHDQKIIEKLST